MRGSREEHEDREIRGYKTFHNKTDRALNLTLYIRHSDSPADHAGTKDVHLQPFQSLGVEYGNYIDRYLNGFSLVATVNGDIVSRQEFVVQRGSALDGLLNTHSQIEIVYKSGFFEIKGHN